MQSIVTELRSIISETAPETNEQTKYGGLVFPLIDSKYGDRFVCGIFTYSKHISIEFSRGNELNDPYNVLEGNGQYRRHIKIHSMDDIINKHVRDYIAQSYQLFLKDNT